MIIAVPVLCYGVARIFYLENISFSEVFDSIPLSHDTVQVASEDSTDVSGNLRDTRKLYTTDQSWNEVNRFYVDYFRRNYDRASVDTYPEASGGGIRIFIRESQKRTTAISISQIKRVAWEDADYTWLSADTLLHDTVAKATTAYEAEIRTIYDLDTYQKNCTD
jgi:hypothetical protein